MNSFFFKSLKDKNVKLSREQLKDINGGLNGVPVSFIAAGSAATCDDGSIVTCLGDSCTGTDGVGCHCTDSSGNTQDRQYCDYA